jgi:F420-dependent oxidoreductase-like protein
MKFGIHHPSWRYGADRTDMFQGLAARARWAEEKGYAWLSVMDHLIQIPIAGAADEPFMEGWTALAALAAVTSRIRLATLATSVHYRNPAILAKIASNVDHISRGRLTLGIGAGWFETEYKQYGYDFSPEPALRIRQMAEAVRLIRAMWTESRTTFHGKWFRAEDAILEPKPVQQPHPPIMIAGSGEQMTLKMVARLGNACNVFGDPDGVRHKFAVLEGHCASVGRAYAEIERTNTVSFILARDQAALEAKVARLEAAAYFRGNVMTPAQAADLVGRYRDAGVQLLIYSAFRNDAETHELFAAEVMPHFA